MEIVYASNFNGKFSEDKINNFYGDLLDLEELGIEIEGIIYDDDKKVKRLLGHNKRVLSILNYLEIDSNILNKEIKDLSKTEFKWMLLAYLLIINKKYIIFDYFDVGLTYKEQKKLIRIIRKIFKDGYKIIVISKNFVFLSQLDSEITVSIGANTLLTGNMLDIVLENSRLFELPEIIKFINLANKKGAELTYTFDSKELLKDIYRGVK